MNRTSFTARTSARTSARIAIAIAVAVTAAGLVLAGCGPKYGSGAASPSGTATGSGGSGGSGGGGTASALIPVAVGNTWVYDETLPTGKGTGTNRMIAVTPAAGGGNRVTMTVDSHVTGLPASKAAKVTLIFHPNGSISYPLTQFTGATVKVKSGSIIWPSTAQISSGLPQVNTLVMTITEGGQTTTVKSHVVVKAAGSATVTVPAGTYSTTIIDETLSENFDGISASTLIRNWVANGVGPVKSEVFSTADGKTAVESTNELKSFTKG